MALGLVFVGCGGSSPSYEYTLSWGIFVPGTYSIEDVVNDQGWVVNEIPGEEAAYVTGNTAYDVYIYCLNNTNFYDGEPAVGGSFETLVNYSIDGISAPPGLQAAMLANKENVPVAGIFKVDSYFYGYPYSVTPNSHVVFYIVKN